MAACSGILAWRIPWTGEPSGLQSTGLQTAGPNLVTKQQRPTERAPEPKESRRKRMTGNELKAEAFVKSLSVYAGKGYPVFYVNKHFVIQPHK